MRLLNTKTFEVNEFYTDIPLYAILSHTWEKEEVTFQNIQNLDVAKTKAGWLKVENACAHARKYTFEWIWIDTCCIDKTSSAELSEALNSMYQYYTDAEVCYVYLSDVSNKENPRDPRSRFRSSKWFTRGWTLQELLAPMYAVFLDTEWEEIGTRWSLRDAISAITTIPIEIFECREHIDAFSIAQKMSWAANRETTRPEDRAYCLMGIFNVSMSPIYGEGGTKAFRRLQQEIIKISDDRSIFVWVSENDSKMGLLASSPKEFRASGQVVMSDAGLEGDKSSFSFGDKSSFSFGNNGLHIYLPLIPVEDSSTHNSVFLAYLHCKRKDITGGRDLFVYLEKIGEQQYVRCRADEVIMTKFQTKHLTEIVVKENSPPRRIRRKDGAIDHVSLTKRIHFELSSSAQCLFALAKQKYKQPDEDDDMRDLYTISARLRYLSEGEDEDFSCTLMTNTFTMVEAVALSSIEKVLSIHEILLFSSENSPADRVQRRLKSGLLHIRLHMGSGQRRVEIDHKFIEDRSLGCRDQLIYLQPLHLRCMVLFFCPGLRSNSLESVFPPNFFDCEGSNQNHMYMACDANTPRLLTYRLEGKRCHVAMGFHGTGEAWIDIFFQQEPTENNVSDYQDIWKSYLDSGVWRIKQASASVGLGVNSSRLSGNYQLTATVRNTQNEALQLWSHSLWLEIKELSLAQDSELEEGYGEEVVRWDSEVEEGEEEGLPRDHRET